jgi:CubicO group peptidase (beta-lactamase class C family)
MDQQMRMAALLIATWATFAPGLAQADAGCGLPSAREDHWAVAAPDSVGLAGTTLCSMVKWLDGSKESNVHAVLVVRHGTLVFERYFSGSDQIWGRPIGDVTFGPDTRHDERSATKSIVALLLGIAIDRGLIKGLEAPVMPFFPEYADLATPAKDRITLRDLITMSAGLEWRHLDTPLTSNANSENQMNNAPDPYRYVLQQAVVWPPGRVWNYNSGSPELIGAILKKATGKPVDELARAWLFAPLDITDVEWTRYANGNPIASGGLRLRPRDLAKIGQLVLQHGVWHDAQVVPAAWIEAATSPQIDASFLNPLSSFYGYQFWLGRSLIDKRTVEWAAAIGLGGQYVYIVPALDLVVVVNAGLYLSPLQGMVTAAILNQYVLEATTPHRD